MNPVDPDGRGLVFHQEKNERGNYITSYEYTDYKSQEELDKNNIQGRYLGNALVIVIGGYNIATKKNYMDEIFLHRTNWDGKATNASVGCLVIDGRSWKDVEKQLRKSKKIFISLTRNKEQP